MYTELVAGIFMTFALAVLLPVIEGKARIAYIVLVLLPSYVFTMIHLVRVLL